MHRPIDACGYHAANEGGQEPHLGSHENRGASASESVRIFIDCPCKDTVHYHRQDYKTNSPQHLRQSKNSQCSPIQIHFVSRHGKFGYASALA